MAFLNRSNILPQKFAILRNYIRPILLVLFLLLSLNYQLVLLNYLEWGDESETIVTAKMMASGLKLYNEIFNHHGPLIFLPGFILEFFGDFNIAAHRIFIVFLQIASLASIYFSPLLRTPKIKVFITGLSATLFLVVLPAFYGHMYKYQTVAGLFLIIILSQYTLPNIYFGKSQDLKAAVLANILIGSLPFLSISFLPISLLIFAISTKRDTARISAIAALLSLVANSLFLISVGSIKGYLAFHIYMNLKILPQFSNTFGPVTFLVVAIRSALKDSTSIIILFVGSIAAYKLSKREHGLPWRTFLLAMGLGSLLIRGWNFHALPYIYSSITFPLVLLGNSFAIENKKTKLLAVGLTAIVFVKLTLILPSDRERFQKYRINYDTEFSRIVKALTNPQDKIAAYTFRNFEYIASERMPASGNFFYLPWQERYNQAPRFGVQIDTCQQLRVEKPKVMLLDKWSEWVPHTWESFGKCIQEFADENYVKIQNRPYYIRSDIISDKTNDMIKLLLKESTQK